MCMEIGIGMDVTMVCNASSSRAVLKITDDCRCQKNLFTSFAAIGQLLYRTSFLGYTPYLSCSVSVVLVPMF
jgi:hypothetical protein